MSADLVLAHECVATKPIAYVLTHTSTFCVPSPTCTAPLIAPPYTTLDGYHNAHAAVVDSHTHEAPSSATPAHDALARGIAAKHPISSLAHALHDPIPDPPHPHMPRTVDMPRLRHALWFSKTVKTRGDDVSAWST